MNHSAMFSRVNTRVTKVFKLRLQYACELRQEETARRVPEGEILSELVNYLKPHPSESDAAAVPKRRDGKREKKLRRMVKVA